MNTTEPISKSVKIERYVVQQFRIFEDSSRFLKKIVHIQQSSTNTKQLSQNPHPVTLRMLKRPESPTSPATAETSPLEQSPPSAQKFRLGREPLNT